MKKAYQVIADARLAEKSAREGRLMTFDDLEIFSRLNDRIRNRCGGANDRYWIASDNYLGNLNL